MDMPYRKLSQGKLKYLLESVVRIGIPGLDAARVAQLLARANNGPQQLAEVREKCDSSCPPSVSRISKSVSVSTSPPAKRVRTAASLTYTKKRPVEETQEISSQVVLKSYGTRSNREVEAQTIKINKNTAVKIIEFIKTGKHKGEKDLKKNSFELHHSLTMGISKALTGNESKLDYDRIIAFLRNQFKTKNQNSFQLGTSLGTNTLLDHLKKLEFWINKSI